MNAPDESWSVLMRAYRAGDLAAGDRLLDRYLPWLRLLARVQMESRFQAKFDPADVVQQALVAAVRAFPQFRGETEAEFAAWLRRILSHALAHEIRRYAGTAKRRVELEVPLEAELTQTSCRLADILPAQDTSPTQVAVRQERQLLLARLLDCLPDDQREVLVLRNLEGLPHDEVARRMGRSPGAVRMLWVRALARLREEALRAGLGPAV